MRYPAFFTGGLALGVLLGVRAGREPYDSLTRHLRRLKDDPATQSAAGLLQARLAGALRPARRAVGVTPAARRAPSIIRLPADDRGNPRVGPEVAARSPR